MAFVCAYVLVAEDDPKQAELVRRYLCREEHAVRVVAGGRSAIDEVRRSRPDLLVTRGRARHAEPVESFDGTRQVRSR